MHKFDTRLSKINLQASTFFTSVLAGIICFLPVLSIQISLASLIFSNNLAQFLPQGISLLFLGTVIITILIAFFSSVPFIISFPQDSPGIILAIIAADMILAMQGAPPESIYYTVLALILISSLVTGLVFFLCGYFKSSKLIRYIPYPVVGGFMAGTGLLLTKGALSVALGNFTSFEIFIELVGSHLTNLISTIVLASLIFILTQKIKHQLIFPAIILLAALCFYLGLFLLGISLPEAAAKGYLLTLPAGQSFQPLTFAHVHEIEWIHIFKHLDQIATILIFSTFSLLLNGSGIGISLNKSLDLDRELMAAGVANMVGAMACSPVGYSSIMATTLAKKLGAKNIVTNLVIGLIFSFFLIFGMSIFAYLPLPKFMLSGILMSLGFSFLYEWLWYKRLLFSTLEYLLIWAIAGVIVTYSLFAGILCGMLLSVFLFILNYSRIEGVKNILDGVTLHSKIERPKAHREILKKKGSQILVIQLQGFIFFGSLNKIIDKVHDRLADKSKDPLVFLIFDCRRVSFIDVSASFAFLQLTQFLLAKHITLMWAEMPPNIFKKLKLSLETNETSFLVDSFPSLDHALEWSENKILAKEGLSTLENMHITDQLRLNFPKSVDIDSFVKYLDRLFL